MQHCGLLLGDSDWLIAGSAAAGLWPWFAFTAILLLALWMDTFVLQRRSRQFTLWESAAQVGFWCLLAAAVNAVIWRWRGSAAATQFLTGYLLEWSLSMDNLFVFAVIFRYFQVPRQHQPRVLFWGIWGAVVMRLGFILAGAALVARFQFVLPLLGAVLIYSAVGLARPTAGELDPERNFLLRLARRWLPMASPGAEGKDGSFFLRQQGRILFTPLFLVLVVIESTDLLFAVDSVPAIFGITRDPFLVFTSNVCAILGLRALYFLLAGVMDLFGWLHYGLASVLGFIGLKMIGQWLFPRADGSELLPTWLSLLVITALLTASIVASIAGRKSA